MRQRSHARGAGQVARCMADARVIAAAAAASIAAYGGEGEASTSRQQPAVLCTSEGGSPWIVKARGTLTRTKSKNEIIYDLDLGGQSYTWRFITSPQGST